MNRPGVIALSSHSLPAAFFTRIGLRAVRMRANGSILGNSVTMAAFITDGEREAIVNVFARRIAVCLVVLIAACSKKETSSTGTTDRSKTAQPSVAVASALEPLPAPSLSSLPGRSLVEVDFYGIICHLKSGNVRRAVLVEHNSHKALLTLPIDYENELQSFFGAAAVSTNGPEASVSIKGMALQLVGTDGRSPVSGYQKDSSFDPQVPGLGGYIPLADLQTAVTGAFPSGPVSAWFELNGGEFVSIPFKCKAKLPTDSAFREFNRYVRGTFVTSTKAKLQIKRSAAAAWQDFPLQAAYVRIKITNGDPTDPDSHFHLFAALSTDTALQIPDPVLDMTQPECKVGGIGTVPGCSNSQWP